MPPAGVCPPHAWPRGRFQAEAPLPARPLSALGGTSSPSVVRCPAGCPSSGEQPVSHVAGLARAQGDGVSPVQTEQKSARCGSPAGSARSPAVGAAGPALT